MRLTVATYGSEGDTRPFVALCRGLVDAGHDVKLFAEQSSVHIAHAHGIAVEPLAGDIKATLPLDNPAQELSTASSSGSSRRVYALSMTILLPG